MLTVWFHGLPFKNCGFLLGILWRIYLLFHVLSNKKCLFNVVLMASSVILLLFMLLLLIFVDGICGMILEILVIVLISHGFLWAILMPSWVLMNKTEVAFLFVGHAWIFKIWFMPTSYFICLRKGWVTHGPVAGVVRVWWSICWIGCCVILMCWMFRIMQVIEFFSRLSYHHSPLLVNCNFSLLRILSLSFFSQCGFWMMIVLYFVVTCWKRV